jgi:hypothetical protein
MKPLRIALGILVAVALVAAVLVFASPRLESRSFSDYAPTPAPTMFPSASVPVAGLLDGDFVRAPGDDALYQDESQPLVDGVARVVLKNAVLSLVVDDVDLKVEQISAMAAEFGGWVVSAQVSRSGGADSAVAYGTITVRVAADRLDQVLALIKDGVHQVESESVTGQDVTQDYVDLSGQVANLESAEAQLQEIMSRATKTEDVLSVYAELVRVRGEIERIRGRLNYYDEASSTSSFQITLRPTPVIQSVEIGGWRPLETARDAFQALVNLLQGAADAVIVVAVFGLPLLLVVGVPLWFIRRRRRHVAAPA